MDRSQRMTRSLADVRVEVANFNNAFPRPGMEPLELSEAFSIPEDWRPGSSYPNSALPGAYFFFGPNQELLYIGSTVGLGQRIGNEYVGRKGVLKTKKFTGRKVVLGKAKTLRTIGVPVDRFFEAMAIEAFLIRRLQPPGNTNLR